MLIQPDTEIRILRNVPFDSSYTHTIYFENLAEQVEYFKGLTKHPLTKQSYQRYDAGVLHIQVPAEQLYNCNYLMFKNSAFGAKWFYAFITSIEYVNNVSSKIKYQIDVMQTWFFDYELKSCFVEREHSKTDNIGENLVPEKLETGEFFVEQLDVENCPFNAGQYHILVLQGSTKINTNQEYECVVSNVFNGLTVTRYDTPSKAYDALYKLNDDGKSDSVVGVFMIPKMFVDTGASANFSNTNIVLGITNGLQNPYDNVFDGFVPKNKKLFTSAYMGLIGTSSSGDTHKYAYEFFSDPTTPRFGICFSVGASPECSITPYNYKGVTGANYNEEIMCKDFPQCVYSSDVFKEYIAQNSGKLIASFASNLLQMAASNNSTNSTLNFANSVLQSTGSLYDKSVLPDKLHGSGGSYLNYNRNTVGFMFYRYKIRREFAEIIDGYFNMFGYATHKVKVPEINNRPYWNYIKTKGCTLVGKPSGGLPAGDADTIKGIYDNGITFWNKDATFGDYIDQDNSPIVRGND